ncbi:class I SAM-dependent methyltransferase [Acetobacter sp.]|uniref:class I SAM-dependent methyltransferase n=1 Tax=Acetobacter sp. TaxID=440 RepID=UPI0039EB2C36
MGRANVAYYASRDPFADFVTAPEISQIFGELIGAWCAVVMQALGGDVRLVEVGPGRGTLMVDMLRVLRRFVASSSSAAFTVHLVETSPRLRAAQKQALDGMGFSVSWHDHVEEVPPGPMLLVANEFLDALPIRQFVRTEAGWAERFVRDGQWLLLPCDDVPPEVAERHVAPEDVVEISPASIEFVRAITKRFCKTPGVALFIDYGTATSCVGESLQALRDARPVSALVEPGTADLTAHVDFASMARAATQAGACCYGPVEQGALLRSLGAVQRAKALCAAAPAQTGVIHAGLDRLIGPDRMGRLFKALAVTSADIGPLPGFPEKIWGEQE